MDALIAFYGESSDRDNPTTSTSSHSSETTNLPLPLPLPPLSPLQPTNSLGALNYHLPSGQPARVRSFPRGEGNYALYVYIPVLIPPAPKKELGRFLKKVSYLVPGLHVVDVDVPFNSLRKDDSKLEQVALGRKFHISLGRTVPIRMHQIDSTVAMLRQKLQSQRRYWIDFSKWEVFVNDDCTRTFLSLEVIAGGLLEIIKQIQAVNEVYRLHNLPEFYKDPRPHISLAWLVGDVSSSLKRVADEEMKRLNIEGSLQKRFFSCKFGGIRCRIGNKTYKICKFSDE